MSTTVNKPSVLQHAKTIHRPFITFVGLEGLNMPAPDGQLIIDAAVTTALASAGRNGTAVPVQASLNIDAPGLVTSLGENRVLIYDNATRRVVENAQGQELFGRLSLNPGDGPQYNVEFLYLTDEGVEQDIDLPAGDYDFLVPYRFTFATLPDDAMIRVKSKRISDDPEGLGGREVMEIVTINATNDLGDLTFTPILGSFVWGHVDGHTVDSLAGGAFSLAGKAMTWNQAVANFDIETTDRMVVHYETIE